MLAGRVVGVSSPCRHGASSTRAHDRWQGGEAGAAVERQDRQVRGDHDGARRELLAGMALRVNSSAEARPEDGAQRRPADRRSEADAGSAGMGRCSPYARSVPPAAALIL